MDTKNLLLGVFVILTLVFGSLTVMEYDQVNTLKSQLSQSKYAPTSFTYAPTGQVQVDSVWATESPAQNGRQDVMFWVNFENIGSSPVYAIEWWVGMMSSTITGNSSVLQSLPSTPCPGAIQLATLNHGQNLTIYTPDCGSGFNYQLVHAGSVSVVLSFGWSTNIQKTAPFSNSTTISADFSFA